MNKTEEKWLKKYNNRFFSEKPIYSYKTSDIWIRSVLKSYYQYFRAVLTKSQVDADKELAEKLKGLINDDSLDLDVIESVLEREFKDRGYQFLGGVTAPFRGPYIWGSEEKVEYTVTLPSGEQPVSVYFMSDFILHGWLHFATFGKYAAGGWAKQNAIYCVKDRQRKGTDHPDFVYSFLTHEAQHFNDYQKFPKLLPRDLEYRAKLVELIYHPNNKKLLTDFSTYADTNKENSHTYASYVISSNFSKWKKAEGSTISSYARQLLDEHTDLLIKAGQESVEGVI